MKSVLRTFIELMSEHASREEECLVCGSSTVLPIDQRTSCGHMIRNVQCQSCGFIFISPCASAEAYAKFYASGFSTEYNQQTAVPSQALVQQAQPKTERLLTFIAPHLRPNMRVLEIGCGFGNVLAALRDRFQAETVGIEPDPQGAPVAKEVFGLDVQTRTFEDFLASWDGKSFDAIIMHHVLEHFLDPNVVGTALTRLLAPGGFVYIGVPNGAWPAYPRSIFFRFPHTLTFTPYSLAYLLWRHDLKVVKQDHWSKPLAFVAVHRADERPSIAWLGLCRASLPPACGRRRLSCANAYHVARLALRKGKAMIPMSLKQRWKGWRKAK